MADQVAATPTSTSFHLNVGAPICTAGATFTMPAFFGVTTIDMNDTGHAIVLSGAGAAETNLTGNVVFCDPNSGGASEILTLPAEAVSAGLVILIANTGGEGIVVNDDGAATIITLDTAQHGIVACDGTSWKGFIGGVT